MTTSIDTILTNTLVPLLTTCSESTEKSLKTIKKLMKTIQTSLETLGKWVKTKMLQIPRPNLRF